ncbi:MAG: MFS transporter, partial [bacterium]
MEPTLTHSPKTWRSWVEPWYVVYALLGATVGGLSPILLPLAVGRTNAPSDVGLVMGAVSLGGLTAPVWGRLAERSRFRRLLLVGGLVMISIGLSAFPFTSKTTALVGLALLQGVGAAAAATVSTLFVVGIHPRAEWHARIGWLQAFYSAGGVGGLLLAGILSHVNLHIGLPMAASLVAVSIPVAWHTTLRPPSLQAGGNPRFPHGAPNIECAFGSPHRYSQLLTPGAVG